MVDGSGDRAEHWNRLGIYPGKFEGILNILCAGDQLCDKRHAGCRAGGGWVVELETGQAV